MKEHKKIRIIVAVLPLIIIILVGIYALVILGQNPSNEPITIQLSLRYPLDAELNTIGKPATGVLIRLKLGFNGALTERQPVTLSAESDAYSTPSFISDLEEVELRIEGAEPYPEKGHVFFDPEGLGGVISLEPKTMALEGTGNATYLTGESWTVRWQVQGNYFPTLTIHYKNGTSVIHNYQDRIIHVGSISELQQENNNNINTALTIALFALAFIESIYLVYDHYPRKQSIGRFMDVRSQNQTTTTHDQQSQRQKWKPSKYIAQKQKKSKP